MADEKNKPGYLQRLATTGTLAAALLTGNATAPAQTPGRAVAPTPTPSTAVASAPTSAAITTETPLPGFQIITQEIKARIAEIEDRKLDQLAELDARKQEKLSQGIYSNAPQRAESANPNQPKIRRRNDTTQIVTGILGDITNIDTLKDRSKEERRNARNEQREAERLGRADAEQRRNEEKRIARAADREERAINIEARKATANLDRQIDNIMDARVDVLVAREQARIKSENPNMDARLLKIELKSIREGYESRAESELQSVQKSISELRDKLESSSKDSTTTTTKGFAEKERERSSTTTTGRAH